MGSNPMVYALSTFIFKRDFMRKIVQIAFSANITSDSGEFSDSAVTSVYSNDELTVLCDDGTVWGLETDSKTKRFKWVQYELPAIPQDESKEIK